MPAKWNLKRKTEKNKYINSKNLKITEQTIFKIFMHLTTYSQNMKENLISFFAKLANILSLVEDFNICIRHW